VSVLPSGSLPTGENAYELPAVTDVAGVPVMVGGRLAGGVVVAACTVIVNCNCEVAWPSLTTITIDPVLPMFAVAGVPVTRPVEGVNVSQAGLF
jgi:hypothetical protein